MERISSKSIAKQSVNLIEDGSKFWHGRLGELRRRSAESASPNSRRMERTKPKGVAEFSVVPSSNRILEFFLTQDSSGTQISMPPMPVPGLNSEV